MAITHQLVQPIYLFHLKKKKKKKKNHVNCIDHFDIILASLDCTGKILDCTFMYRFL